ncbi:MAG: amidohydrolase family protein [Rubrivivax sp.]
MSKAGASEAGVSKAGASRAGANTLLIRNALVLTMDPQLGDRPRCDIRVEDGRIAEVGTGLSGDGAEVIDAAGMIAIPGLIDSHTHMWQGPLKGQGAGQWGFADYQKTVFSLRGAVSPADMKDGTFAAGVEMLDNGITTALDFCHNVMSPEHALQGIEGHARTGQRVVFAYGMLGAQESLAADQPWKLAQVRELHASVDRRGALMRLALALGSLEYTGLKLFAREVELAQELGMVMTFHQNPPGQIRELAAAGLLCRGMLPVHANLCTDEELQQLAAVSAAISFTVEGEFGGGRAMDIVGRAHRAGVLPTLGIDIPSRVALDLFGQMRLTFHVMRAEEAAAERRVGRWPLVRRPGSPFTTPRHMLEYVTVNAAQALGMADSVGRIAPGLRADIVLLRTGPYGISVGDPAAHVALQACAADVDTVLVDGVVRKRGGQLQHVDRAEALAATRRVRERVLKLPS